MILFALLLACNPSVKDTAASDTGPTGVFVPDLPTGGCDMPAYDWVDDTRLGEIVDWEEMPDWSMSRDTIQAMLALNGITAFDIPYGTKAWRVRYVTQDRGQEIESTAMIGVPDEDGSWPLVLAPHGTCGFTDICAPSGGDMEDQAFNLLFTALGHAVAAPDYLGMNGMGAPSGFVHPYLVPEATAVATLDAGRALLRFQADQGLTSTANPAQTMMWGGSEGGFAALWADRYGTGYVPEITIIGTLAAVAPTDLTALAKYALAELSDPSYAYAAGVVAWHEWYQSPAALDTVFVPDVAAALPGEMLSSCDDFPSVEGATSITDIFLPEIAAAASDPASLDPWGCYMAMGDLASTQVPRGSSAPVLMQISEADPLVLPDTIRDSIPTLCGQGYHIEHLECEGAGHTEGAVNSLPYQAAWMDARVAGEALASDCVINEPVDCEAFLEGP